MQSSGAIFFTLNSHLLLAVILLFHSQVLQHVQVFEAANDLSIGNHTLSALRFQASGLRKNSIIFAGAEGMLSDSDKFSYTKGPAARIDKLLSSIDVRGNDIR